MMTPIKIRVFTPWDDEGEGYPPDDAYPTLESGVAGELPIEAREEELVLGVGYSISSSPKF